MKVALVNNLHFDSLLDYKVAETTAPEAPLRVSTPPLGVLLLAAVLRDGGHQVEVVDFADLARRGEISTGDGFYGRAAAHLAVRGADVVGFTTRCDDYHCQLRIARGLKRLAPGTPIVFGGPQATVSDLRTLELFSEVDFVIRNEAEETLPELLAAWAAGGDLGTVAGLSWRRDGVPTANPDRPLIADLDALPTPAYDLYTRDFVGRWPIEVGRGCPFSCTFCSTAAYFHRTYRLKSGPRLVAELRALSDRYGVDEFMFVHDMLTVDRKRLTAVCECLTEADLGVRWNCSARMDCIDDKLLDAMRAAGCDGIYMGIEAGSRRLQKVLRKNLRLENLEPTVKRLRDKEFAVTTSFITGFEEETLSDVEETLATLLRCVLIGVELVQLHLWAPQVGSELFARGRDRLAYDGYLSDQVDPLFFSPEDLDLVLAHPEVFPGFFHVPGREVPRSIYHGLDYFGYACGFFPQTLYFAVETSDLGLLDLFVGLQRWLAQKRGIDLATTVLPMRRFHALMAEYLEGLIDGGRLTYPYLRDVLRFNVAYTRFQHRPARGEEIAPTAASADLGERLAYRDSDIEVHQFSCDIRRLIQAVNELQPPPADPGLARRSAVVLKRIGGRVGVLGLPALCKTALELCDGRRTFAAVEAALTASLAGRVPPAKAAELAAGAVHQPVTSGLAFAGDAHATGFAAPTAEPAAVAAGR